MYVVTGVSGHVGPVVARELLARGEKVRVVVRASEKGHPWSKLGAEVAVASFDEPAAFARAISGAYGLFVLNPPPSGTFETPVAFLDAQKLTATNLATAVAEGRPRHVVFLSSVGGQHESGTGPIAGLHFTEEALRRTGVPLQVIRPAYFMENFAGLFGAAQHAGIYPNFLGEMALSTVATVDIGRAVSLLLLNPCTPALVELAGPRDVDAHEIARLLGQKFDRQVQVVDIPAQGALGALLESGLPPVMAALYEEMYRGIREGHVAFLHPATLWRGTVTLAQFFSGQV